MRKLDPFVLVGYDGSDRAAADAVVWAATEAVRRDQRLVVLFATGYAHLHDTATSLAHGPSPTLVNKAQLVAEKGVALARSSAPSVNVEPLVSSMGAAAALCELSRDASVVVMGTQRYGRITQALLGSVVFAVATHGPAPVVVVRGDNIGPAGPGRPIVVGIDGSSGSDAALDPAADVAAQCGADLILVSAWETPRPDHWSQIYLADDAWRKDAIETASQGASIAVKRARAKAQKRHPKLTIHELVQEGRPDRVLVRAHANTGLIVVGARGRSDFVSLLLGSVSRAVVHVSTCPVAIIR